MITPITFSPTTPTVLPVPVVTGYFDGTNITLSWSTLLGVAGYRVYRRSDRVPHPIPLQAGTTVSFTEDAPTDQGDLFYFVRSFQGASESANSNVETVRGSASNFMNLPTTDPHIAGQPWNDGGMQAVSNG